MKTTSPKKYCVRPNTGIVKPKTTCDFTGICPSFPCPDLSSPLLFYQYVLWNIAFCKGFAVYVFGLSWHIYIYISIHTHTHILLTSCVLLLSNTIVSATFCRTEIKPALVYWKVIPRNIVENNKSEIKFPKSLLLTNWPVLSSVIHGYLRSTLVDLSLFTF